MRDDMPSLRMETRYDGIPEMTEAERSYHAAKAGPAPQPQTRPAPAPEANAKCEPALTTVDPVFVDQLVRWGGMTFEEAVQALLKGHLNEL